MIRVTLKYVHKTPIALVVTGPKRVLAEIPHAYVSPFRHNDSNRAVMPLTPRSLKLDVGTRVLLADEVSAWLSAEQRARDRQRLEMYNADSSSNDDQLYDFQARGVRFLLGTSRWHNGAIRALLADDPRLGKTVQALRTFDHIMYTPTLVLTMKPLVNYWTEACHTWLNSGLEIISLDPKPKLRVAERYKLLAQARQGQVFVTNWATIRMNKKQKRLPFPTQKFKTVIGDEAHTIKNKDAQVTRGLLSLRPKNIILATATPIERGPQDYYTYLRLLNRQEFGSYWRWIGWFCNTHFNGFGTEIDGPKNIEILQDLLLPRVLRREAHDVANVPEKIYEEVNVKPNTRFMSYYSKLETEIFIELDNDETLTIPNKLARMVRLRQLSVCPKTIGINLASPKAGVVATLAEKFSGTQLLVFTSFRASVKQLIQELTTANISCAEYSSNTPNTKIEFEQDRLQVLCTTPYIGGVGQDFSCADIIVFLDLPLSATVLRQAIERTTKIGLKRPRLIITINATPIDHAVSRILRRKQTAITDADILTEILPQQRSTT